MNPARVAPLLPALLAIALAPAARGVFGDPQPLNTAGIAGFVRVRLIVDGTGRVSKARALYSSRHRAAEEGRAPRPPPSRGQPARRPGGGGQPEWMPRRSRNGRIERGRPRKASIDSEMSRASPWA